MTFSPTWAPHVRGTWTERQVDTETGEVDPAIITIVCDRCKATQKIECRTGQVRRWINMFAKVHFHADPLAPRK